MQKSCVYDEDIYHKQTKDRLDGIWFKVKIVRKCFKLLFDILSYIHVGKQIHYKVRVCGFPDSNYF